MADEYTSVLVEFGEMVAVLGENRARLVSNRLMGHDAPDSVILWWDECEDVWISDANDDYEDIYVLKTKKLSMDSIIHRLKEFQNATNK